METTVQWDNEIYTDHDANIAALEAEIAASKALLASLSNDEENDIF